jgi:UDP-N-acetylglucosamine:LPS N-acetylglucosamine transferase
MKLLLVCSSGGHFAGMVRMERFWSRHSRAWVTFDSPSTRGRLAGERVWWAFSPTNRNLFNLVRNFCLAIAVLLREQPEVILSTGAGVAVPFLVLGRLFGCRVAFVESLTRTTTLSLSARLVLPIGDVYVQWPQLQQRYPKTIYAGVTSL